MSQVLDTTRTDPEEIVAGLTVKADKIRKLAEAGYSRTEISKFLELRYQDVRHVLIRSGMAEHGLKNGNDASVPKNNKTIQTKNKPDVSWEVLLRAGFQFLGEWTAIENGIVLDTKI